MMIEARAGLSDNYECFQYQKDLWMLANPVFKARRHEDFERHPGQSNVLFVDGHVDMLLPHELGKMSQNQEHFGTRLYHP